MTNEEAIKWLQFDIDMMKFNPTTGEEAYLDNDAKKVIEAEKLVISALEKQDALKQPTFYGRSLHNDK